MAFQFTCPHGHLLSADESLGGQHCQCPHCGVVFVLPPPAGFPPAGFAPPNPFPPSQQLGFPQPGPPMQTPAPGMMPGAGPSSLPADLLSELPTPPTGPGLPAGAGAFGGPASFGDALPELLHIPCPNGHELETPHEMLGQHVMCPFCQAQFMLAVEQSVEYKKRREMEQEALDERRGQLWFRWAIAFAVLVLIGLVALIVTSNR